jgi:uncharacterized ferritin-like protein (DUF455 family)
MCSYTGFSVNTRGVVKHDPSRDGLFTTAYRCLMECEPDVKMRITRQAAEAWRQGRLELSSDAEPEAVADPGRPQRPRLVHPRDLPRRTLAHDRGRAALIHAVTHIEFNAVNLAWDAVYRFRGLPRGFYDDWVGVAEEEARHFHALRGRLRGLGCDYGDFPAHNGLWDMALRTAHDILARMALVPRVLEARGLDVTPEMIRRLRAAGDRETAAVLEVVLQEEVGHVASGTRWFRHVCGERGLEPEAAFFDLLQEFLHGEIRCPLHLQARREAGFSESELQRLETLCR